MTSRTDTHRSAGSFRIALPVPAILGAAVVAAIAVNSVVAAIAGGNGAEPGWPPLSLPLYGSFTTIGVLGGWAGWRLVERRAGNPPRVLSRLVPAVLALSFAPDLALLAFRFIPGTTTIGVIALMTMHLVVAAIALPAYVLASRR